MSTQKRLSTRERILESAWRLLEKAGGKEVRMSDIATHAGVSRQTVYVNFPTRAELLVATTHYIDAVKDIDQRLAASRQAKDGLERLDAFIEAWGGYIPEIHGVARELMAASGTDEAARLAWEERMQALRQGCRAAVEALKKDGRLARRYNLERATDILWTLLSVRAWELLTIDCGWPQASYVKEMKTLARRVLASTGAAV